MEALKTMIDAHERRIVTLEESRQEFLEVQATQTLILEKLAATAEKTAKVDAKLEKVLDRLAPRFYFGDWIKRFWYVTIPAAISGVATYFYK